MKIPEVVTFHDRRNWFTIRMWAAESSYVSFQVHEIKGFQGDEIWYERADSKTQEETLQLSQAQIFCSGDIKWNECMNLQFNAQEKGAMHFCSNPGKKLKDLMDRLFDMATNLMPPPDNASKLVA